MYGREFVTCKITDSVAKIKLNKLGCEPKTTLEQLCQMMLEADLRRNEIEFSF